MKTKKAPPFLKKGAKGVAADKAKGGKKAMSPGRKAKLDKAVNGDG